MISSLVLLALVAGSFAMPGGLSDIDVNDPYLNSLLGESYFPASRLDAQNAMVVRVQKQVVAGFKYIVTFEVNGGRCDVTLWDKLDGSVEVLDDMCVARPMRSLPGTLSLEEDNLKAYYTGSDANAKVVEVKKTVKESGFKYVITFGDKGGRCDVALWEKYHDGGFYWEVKFDSCASRTVRSLPGGWMTQDRTSKVYLDMLNEVYFASNNAMHPDDLELVKVESQVASGINYKFTFKVGGSEVTCQVVITQQAWLNSKTILSETCQNIAVPMCGPGMWGPDWEREWERTVKLTTPICGPGMWEDWYNDLDRTAKRSMPGGFVDQDATDEYFTDMLAEVYFSSNGALQQEDLELLKVQSQVVNGVNYKFIFKVTGSEVTCAIVINHQPWGSGNTLFKDGCTNVAVPMY